MISSPLPAYQPKLWYARSDRTSTRFYAVSYNPRTLAWACECPDHQRRHRACKHILRAQSGDLAPATVKGLGPAPRAITTSEFVYELQDLLQV